MYKFWQNNALSAVLIPIIVVLGLSGWGVFDAWQKDAYDVFVSLNSRPDSGQVVVISIDDKSLHDPRLGRYQDWQRGSFAEAIRELKEAGVKVIGLDVSMPEDSSDPRQDQILAQSIEDADNVILVAEAHKDILLTPIDTLSVAAHSVGLANMEGDNDNVIRAVSPIQKEEGGLLALESFAYQVARTYLDKESFFDFTIRNWLDDGRRYRFDDQTIIPLSDKMMLINYFGQPKKSFRYLSFIDLLNGDFRDQNGQEMDLDGKIALIGATALDLQDLHATPVSRGVLMPGIEIHANIVETILSGKFLRPLPAIFAYLILILLALVAVYLFYEQYRGWIFIPGLALVGLLWLSATMLFSRGWVIETVTPTVIVIALYISAVVYHHLKEQRQRKFIHNAFSHYLSPEVVSKIADNPEVLKLGGEQREVSVFFSDIAGFTSISEKMTPAELVGFLNEYLGAMTDIILEEGGTLDKYQGDAIMAFWGAPLPQEDHARRACLTGIRQLDLLDKMRIKWKKRGLLDINIRIGINTGEVIVGNMGSERRFNYTIMGDAVNLASRLESAGKQYGVRFIISEFTLAQIRDAVVVRELDLVKVKGKNQPVRIYEVLAGKDRLKQEKAAMLVHYRSGLEYYKKQEWNTAMVRFEKALGMDADDGPSKVYLDRCREYQKNPPSQNWDGVYEMKSK